MTNVIPAQLSFNTPPLPHLLSMTPGVAQTHLLHVAAKLRGPLLSLLLLLGVLIGCDGGGDGGGNQGGVPSSSAPAIVSLSTTSAAPAQLLTLTGTGFDPTSQLRARFSSSSLGTSMDAPALEITSTSITVVVPPLSSATGSATDVTVRVVQQSGTAELVSNAFGPFTITRLPSLTVAPGTVTLRVLAALRFAGPDLKNQLLQLDTTSRGAINTAALRSALDDLAVDVGALADTITALMRDPTRSENVGTFRGVPVVLDQRTLSAMDQLLAAYFLALVPPASTSRDASLIEEALVRAQTRADTCGFAGPAQDMVALGLSPTLAQDVASLHFYQAIAACKANDEVLKVAKVGGGFSGVLGLAALATGTTLPASVLAVLAYTALAPYTFVLLNEANTIALGRGTRQDAENTLKAFEGFLQTIAKPIIQGVLNAVFPTTGRLFSIGTKLDAVRKATQVLVDQVPSQLDQIFPPPASQVLSVTPASLDFGSVTVGSSGTATFTVKNIGSGTLSGKASTSLPFSITAGGTYALTAGQSQPVTVQFKPTEAGTFAGTVGFTGGDGASFMVRGVGTMTPPPPSQGIGACLASTCAVCNSDSDCPDSLGCFVGLFCR